MQVLWFLALERAGCSCARHEGMWRSEMRELTTLALDGDEWSDLCPGRFVPEINPPITVTMRLCIRSQEAS